MRFPPSHDAADADFGSPSDTDASLRDVEAVLSTESNDVLCLSLRASLRGNTGDTAAAQADLAATNTAIRSGKVYRSKLGDSDCDLEYLARGWAYSVVRDFAAAAADFGFSANLRNLPDPYATGALPALRWVGCRSHTLSQPAMLSPSSRTKKREASCRPRRSRRLVSSSTTLSSEFVRSLSQQPKPAATEASRPAARRSFACRETKVSHPPSSRLSFFAPPLEQHKASSSSPCTILRQRCDSVQPVLGTRRTCGARWRSCASCAVTGRVRSGSSTWRWQQRRVKSSERMC